MSFFVVSANILAVGKNPDTNGTFSFDGEPLVERLRLHEDMQTARLRGGVAVRHPQLTVEGERLVYEVRVVVVVVHQLGDVRVHLLHR